MHRVVVLALGEVVAFDLAIAAQVFGREPARYEFCVCGARPGPVATSTGFGLLVDHGLEALADADTVIVPGIEETAIDPRALDALRTAHARGARMVSICTGAFVLAAAGLLDGRRATTHWAYADRLAHRHPLIDVDPNVLYVDDGDVLTSAGVAAGIDLCLHIVRTDHGADFANAVARRIVVAAHREGGQAQFVDQPLPERGTRGLGPTRAWALSRLSAPLTIGALADHAATSERTFARRFRAETGTTALQWLLTQRVLLARRLLEASDAPIEQVAGDCGFGSATSLRQHFARALGTTPSAYRRAFRAAP